MIGSLGFVISFCWVLSRLLGLLGIGLLCLLSLILQYIFSNTTWIFVKEIKPPPLSPPPSWKSKQHSPKLGSDKIVHPVFSKEITHYHTWMWQGIWHDWSPLLKYLDHMGSILHAKFNIIDSLFLEKKWFVTTTFSSRDI